MGRDASSQSRASGRRPRTAPVSRGALVGQQGQSTVEFAAVVAGVLAVLAALAVMAQAFSDGTLLDLAEKAASHAVDPDDPLGTVADVFLF